MNRNRIRTAACCLTATVVLSSSSFVSNAAPTAGAGNFVSTALTAEATESNSTGSSARCFSDIFSVFISEAGNYNNC